MQARGLDVPSNLSDDDILGHFAQLNTQNEQARQELEQLRQMTGYANEYMQNADQFRQWQEQQQAAQQAAQQPQEPSWQEQVPEYDAAWHNQVKWDAERREYIAETWDRKPVADKLNAYNRWALKQQQDLLRDPWGVASKAGAKDYIDQQLHQMRAEIANDQYAQFNQYMQQQRENDFWEQNKQTYFEHDENGNIVIDPQTNQWKPNQLGEMYQHAQQMAPYFVDEQNPEKIRQFALMVSTLAANNAAGQQATGTPQEQTTADQKQNFMDRARKNAKDHASQPREHSATVAHAAAQANRERISDADLFDRHLAAAKQSL